MVARDDLRVVDKPREQRKHVHDKEACHVYEEQARDMEVGLLRCKELKGSKTDCRETHGNVGRTWDVALWVLHFSDDVIGLVGTIEGPQNSGKRNCIQGGCRRWIERTIPDKCASGHDQGACG